MIEIVAGKIIFVEMTVLILIELMQTTNIAEYKLKIRGWVKVEPS